MCTQHTKAAAGGEASQHEPGRWSQRFAEGITVPLDLPGLRIVGQRWTTDGEVEVTVIGTPTRAPCPRCGRLSAQQHDVRNRRKRDVSLGAFPVILILRKRRFRCCTCQRVFTELDSACGWRRRTTARLRETLGEAARTQPVAHVAAAYRVGARLVRACVETVVEQRLRAEGRSLDEASALPTPRYLGIDEFARRKGQRYDTLLCDLERRRALEVSAGRTQVEVVRLLERLDDPERVAAVSMDMSLTFREAVRLCLPRAQIVADHFHVVQHVGKALARVWRRCAQTAAGRIALRGKRHLFVCRREALEPAEQQARAALAVAFPDLGAAWQAKEDLRAWYASATVQTAAAGLDAWVAAVTQTGPDELRRTLSAFTTWRAEILAFFTFLPLRLSNGFVEGKNNRTKALMRQAYGYRNRRSLRARILGSDLSSCFPLKDGEPIRFSSLRREWRREGRGELRAETALRPPELFSRSTEGAVCDDG